MKKVNAYQTGSGSQAEDSALSWRRIPLLPGDVIGGRRVLMFFRYISWFLTSMFYLGGSPGFPLAIKLVIILALLTAARVAVRLYDNSKGNPANIFGIIIVDTLFISGLLIPTGGLASPFMWYALNPIFMAISLLPGLYCILVLGFMLLNITAGAFYNGNALTVLNSWRNNSLFSLVFLLLTTATLLFARLAKQLSEAYEKLAGAHNSAERQLEHISNLYQALEAFSGREEPRSLASLLADYARKLTGSQAGVCYLFLDQFQPLWEIADPDGVLSGFRQVEVETVFQRIKEGQAKVYRLPLKPNGLEERLLVCVQLRSPSALFGLLGYVALPDPPLGEDEGRALTFLADLGAIVLERHKADDLAAHLLVAEEQNRIANEIHDGVSQQLFSIVYALHALSKKHAGLQDGEVQRQLNLISKTANQAARDLRASIYRISPRKRGEQIFVAGVSTYLADLAKLNGINVDLQAEGSEEALSPALRNALYRIIREATSNAIRHGKCRNIKVNLGMALEQVLLLVVDDGRGFNNGCQQIEGLGIDNMRRLMASFNGRFAIESEPGRGARVTCVVPDYSGNEVKLDMGGVVT